MAANPSYDSERYPGLPVSASRKYYADLQAELEELERTDPDVAAAAASYDRMVEDLTRKVPKARFPRKASGCDQCDHETRGHHPGQCDYLSCPCCGPDLCVHCGHGVALHDNDVPSCLTCDCDRVVFDDGPGAA